MGCGQSAQSPHRYVPCSPARHTARLQPRNLQREKPMNSKLGLALATALVLVIGGCSSKTEKVCSDFCGAGSACVGNTCQAILSCEPACGTGEACQDGACVATLDSACTGACAAGQICVTGGGSAACV